MFKKLCFVAVAFLLNFSQELSAQEYIYSSSKEVAKETVNFMELASYEKANPKAVVRKKPMKEEEEEINLPIPVEPDPSLVRVLERQKSYKPSVGGSGVPSPLMPVSSNPTDTFQGSLSGGTNIPPDTHGGVSANHVVTATNSSLRIQSRTGAVISTVSLDGFWGTSVLSGTGSFDPRVHYDPYSNRWIVVAVSVNGSFSASRILVAVSATADPTGTWYKTGYNVYSGGSWVDFPNVGFNSKWIVITGNYFTAGGSFTSTAIWCFNKAALYSNTSTTPTKISGTGGFTLAPAVTYDATAQSLFIAEIYNRSASAGGQLRLRKITGAVGSPVLSSALGYPSAASLPSSVRRWQQRAAGGADFAPQLGTTNRFQTNDDRINNLCYRNGKLWTAHTVFYPSSGTVTRASVMWWQMDTVGTPNQVGVIDDPTNAKHYAFPCIAVNSADDALVGYSNFASTQYAGAAYSLHLHTDPDDSMQKPFIFRHGQKPYYRTFGGGENRWGDYSGTCIDPANDNDFWTVQECVPNYSGPISSSLWDTWWARVQICPTPSAPVLTASPTSLCEGASGFYSIASVTGALSYTWSVSGTGWSGASSTTSNTITAGTGPGVVTVYASNACGAGSALVFTVTPTTVPPAPTISTVSPACVGTLTATYSAATTGATSYNWSVTGAGWSGASSSTSFTATVGVGTATITVSGINACGVGPVATMTVTPGTPPAAPTSITEPTLLCSGKTAVYSTPSAPDATSYTWGVAGTDWSGTSTTNTLTATAGTGAGTITVTPVNGCGPGTPYSIVTPVPTITPSSAYTATAHVTNVSVPVTITVAATPPAGSTYTWNFGGGAAIPGSGAGPHTVSWTTVGTKTVTLTIANAGCSTPFSDTVRVKTTVELAKVEAKHMTLDIVPNPSRGSFEIKFDQNINKPVSIRLLDIQGKTVYSNDYGVLKANKISVSGANLAAGTYIANVYIDDETLTHKVTITE